MEKLNLPSVELRISMEKEVTTVFDILRKKNIVLTPEEWVRQHFLHFAIDHLHYPKSLIKVESGHNFNGMPRRSDLILYDNKGEARVLIECKAATESLGQEALNQAIRYNSVIKARYVVLTNGLKNFCCEYLPEKGNYEFIQEIPRYEA